MPITPIARNDHPIDAGVRIGHVHLKAADLQKIFEFYVGVLGFDVITRMESALFLSAGGYHHHLAFNTWQSNPGSLPSSDETRLYHIAINYPSRESLGDALRRLTNAKWPLEGASDHGTHEALYLADPEGNGLELAWDRPEKDWPLDPEGRLLLQPPAPLDLESLAKAGLKAKPA